jgi:hypothetical protein
VSVIAKRGPVAILRATAIAGVLSGVPSTLHAIATGRSPLEAMRAAAALAPGAETRSPSRQAIDGIAVHAALSLGWTIVLARTLPGRHTAAWGAVAGLVIAALDLGLVGSQIRSIRRLPQSAQVADHVAFGAIAGTVLASTGSRMRPGQGR